MSISITGSSLSAALGKSAHFSGAAPTSALEAAIGDFKKIASQTPMERIRDQVLKRHDLSKDAYEKLPKEKKDAIDKEIADAVKEMVKRDSDHKGRNVNKVA